MFELIDSIVGLKDDGVTQPTSHHQRYRRGLFLGKGFFQWWFIMLRDSRDDRHMAICIHVSDPVRDLSQRGVYVMFSMIEPGAKTAMQRYERFSMPEAALSETELDVTVHGQNSEVQLRSSASGDQIEINGRLCSPERTWFADGRLSGHAIDDLPITFDLTLHRLFGWHGHDDHEEQLRRDGMLAWNTFAHTSEVEGQVFVGDRRFSFERCTRFRAYADMDWGAGFPRGEPAIAYPWGWYYVGRPAESRAEEIAIIAGTGVSEDTLLGRPGRSLGLHLASEGRCADLRLGNNYRVGVREIRVLKKVQEHKGSFRTSRGRGIVVRSSDGELQRFRIERDRWTDYVDGFGRASIPLSQTVEIKTKTASVKMVFETRTDQVNRILFPFEEIIYSDFEALGVHCTVDAEVLGRPLRFETNDAGLEFGYLAPGRI